MDTGGEEQWDGVVVLRKRPGDEKRDVAIMINLADGQVTYTVQSIDRRHRETLRATVEQAAFLLDVLSAIDRMAVRR